MIRAATIDDLPIIETLIRELAEFENLSHEVVATQELLRHSMFGPRAYAEALLVFEDEEYLGFAVFFHTFSTFLSRPGLYIEDIYVRPQHRSKGIGKALIERLAAIALERECQRMEWAVLDWNADAIRFYEKIGARPNSEWTTYRLDGQALTALSPEIALTASRCT